MEYKPRRVKTYVNSYYEVDGEGNCPLGTDGLPVRKEGRYYRERDISPNRAALIVMDPWVNSPSDHLRELSRPLLEDRIIPLVGRMAEIGYNIYIATNGTDAATWSSGVHPALYELAEKYNKIVILEHEDIDAEKFADTLHTHDIDKLIYCGFRSNACILGRGLGMLNMREHGFRVFLVPEASAATEYPDSWDTQYVHKAMTFTVGLWIGEIINYDDLMGAMV